VTITHLLALYQLYGVFRKLCTNDTRTNTTMSQIIQTRLCFSLLCLGLFLTTATAKPIDFTELDRVVSEELKATNTPGAVIAVVSGNEIVYQKAFGVASVETNAPMQPEMVFRLGSTTKMFTAAALLTLAEKDKIKLNEPIGDKVKGLNAKIAKVTPHHLLSNSAGFRDFAATAVSNDDASLGNMVRSWKGDVSSRSKARFIRTQAPASGCRAL
jgi:CubicO group peptidase (beta-lactamase class C family)